MPNDASPEAGNWQEPGHGHSVAEQRVADLTTMLNDIREQRDRWQAQADRLGSVLTDQGRRAPPWWPWRRLKRDDIRLQITDMRDKPSDLKNVQP